MHWKMLRRLYPHYCRSPERMRVAMVCPDASLHLDTILYILSDLIVVEVRFSVKAAGRVAGLSRGDPFGPIYLLLKGSYVENSE